MHFENKVNWHPFPKEKPSVDRRWYLTSEIGSRDNLPLVFVEYWQDEEWVDMYGYTDKGQVKAWAYLPEPYDEETETLLAQLADVL